jgi:hypothetical protein
MVAGGNDGRAAAAAPARAQAKPKMRFSARYGNRSADGSLQGRAAAVGVTLSTSSRTSNTLLKQGTELARPA